MLLRVKGDSAMTLALARKVKTNMSLEGRCNVGLSLSRPVADWDRKLGVAGGRARDFPSVVRMLFAKNNKLTGILCLPRQWMEE